MLSLGGTHTPNSQMRGPGNYPMPYPVNHFGVGQQVFPMSTKNAPSLEQQLMMMENSKIEHENENDISSNTITGLNQQLSAGIGKSRKKAKHFKK